MLKLKLSIIVPFHRGIHFLEDCLESIRDQGLSSFETVLVLDHVEEDLTRLLENYQDINIKKVELKEEIKNDKADSEEEENLRYFSGVARARNIGLEAADGEYIYFLDSDDYILNNTLSLLLKEAQEQIADFTYGRRASTWFKRKVYLASQEENDSETQQEEQDPGEDNENEVQEIQLTRRERRLLNVQQAIEEASELENDLSIHRAEAYYSLFVSRKGLRNVSVLGILFRKSFLEENNLHFTENFTYFSDLSFLTKALVKVKVCSVVPDAIYVKRKHNDPIHYPALAQIKTEDRFEEYVEAYKMARQITEENSVIRHYLENKLMSYFTGTYAPRLRRSEKESWRTFRFQMMKDCMQEVDKENINRLKGYRRRVVKALLSGNVNRTTRVVNMHLGWKKLKRIRKKWNVFSYYLYQKVFYKMPLKENWVLCESFFGKSYSDSPKYIYEYLAKNYPGKYRFIWVINKKTKIPFNPTKVKRYSIRYAYYLARCKYDVFNVRQPDWVRKREGNVFLETWHGTPLKKLVFDQDEVMAASPLYKAQFFKNSRIWDYLVSANYFSTECFKSAFLFDKKFLEYGYPRNDILHYDNKDEIADNLRAKFGIPKNKKTILYAPTWRDDEYYGKGQYKFDLKLDLRMLRRELGEDYVVLLRTHYYIADQLDVTGLEGFAVNLSKYDDISELYLISDILITDYSSVFFDYANLKRPILFYTYDLDKYRDMLRGFYMDIETEVPGPLLYTTEEVIKAIQNIDVLTQEYKEKYAQFYERFCGLEDGHASENVCKEVFNL